VAFLRFGSGLLSASQSIVALSPQQFPLGKFPQTELITLSACVFLQIHGYWDFPHFCHVVVDSQKTYQGCLEIKMNSNTRNSK